MTLYLQESKISIFLAAVSITGQPWIFLFVVAGCHYKVMTMTETFDIYLQLLLDTVIQM